ncbi:hypothetical protein Tco_0430967 [Tanacetum coccineum]
MERFENAIFKQREEINDRMTEMFGLLKELTTSRTPEKVLITEDAKSPVTKNVNSISLAIGEEEMSENTDETLDNTVKSTHRINEKLIEGLVDNNRFNDSLSRARTGKASNKFDKGTITLRSGKSKISFHWIPNSPCMTEKGVKNDIEPIAPTMTVNRLVLEWEERIKLHLEREMEFNRWRSKNFKGKHPALITTKGGMEEEGEVT